MDTFLIKILFDENIKNVCCYLYFVEVAFFFQIFYVKRGITEWTFPSCVGSIADSYKPKFDINVFTNNSICIIPWNNDPGQETFWKQFGKRKNAGSIFTFSPLFSTLSGTNFAICATIYSLSASNFNLDQAKIFLFGREFTKPQILHLSKLEAFVDLYRFHYCWNGTIFLWQWRKHCEIRRKSWLPAFPLYIPTMFLKGFCPRGLNPFPNKPWFHAYAVHVFWKHCGKRRNYSWRAISPFPTVFSTDFENCLPVSSYMKYSQFGRVENLSFGKGLNIGIEW